MWGAAISYACTLHTITSVSTCSPRSNWLSLHLFLIRSPCCLSAFCSTIIALLLSLYYSSDQVTPAKINRTSSTDLAICARCRQEYKDSNMHMLQLSHESKTCIEFYRSNRSMHLLRHSRCLFVLFSTVIALLNSSYYSSNHVTSAKFNGTSSAALAISARCRQEYKEEEEDNMHMLSHASKTCIRFCRSIKLMHHTMLG